MKIKKLNIRYLKYENVKNREDENINNEILNYEYSFGSNKPKDKKGGISIKMEKSIFLMEMRNFYVKMRYS